MHNITFQPQSNRASWLLIGQVVDQNDELFDLTNCSMVCQVSDKDGGSRLSATSESGRITYPDLGTFRMLFSVGELNGLEPGTYSVGITLTNDDGTQTAQLGYGPLPIIDGIVP